MACERFCHISRQIGLQWGMECGGIGSLIYGHTRCEAHEYRLPTCSYNGRKFICFSLRKLSN